MKSSFLAFVVGGTLLFETSAEPDPSPPADMKVAAVIAELNQAKVRDLPGLSGDEELDSAKLAQRLVFEISKRSGKSLVVHWQLPSSSWKAPQKRWQVKKARDLPVRRFLDEIVRAEGWNYEIRDGYLLIRQFH